MSRTPEVAAWADAYRGKRVLVTGHTGFKGAWLSAWLTQLGARVSGLALAPRPGGIFLRGRLEEALHHHQLGDVRSADEVRAALDAAEPDLVIHMAAQALVRHSYVEPAETFATNVMGTVNVLEALRQRGARCACIVVTSDKAYLPAPPPHRHVETDPLGGHDPYSASKGAADIVVNSYRASAFSKAAPVALASVRAGNCIGGGDVCPDRLVVDAVAALRAGKPVPVRNPQAVRPFQHLLDPLHGYLLLGAKLLQPDAAARAPWAEPFNFGPDVAAPVSELVDTLCRAWGDGGAWTASEQAGPHEAHSLALDASKARARLGWSCRLSLEEAAQWIVDWERRADGAPPAEVRRLTDEHLQRFSTRLAGAQ